MMVNPLRYVFEKPDRMTHDEWAQIIHSVLDIYADKITEWENNNPNNNGSS